MNVFLEIMVMSGPDDGLTHVAEGDFVYNPQRGDQVCRLTIGRRDTCDFCVPFDTLVSRLHASLEVTPEGEIWLIDEKSRNGTFVGREKLAIPHPLAEGHFFKVGKTLLRLQQIRIAQEV